MIFEWYISYRVLCSKKVNEFVLQYSQSLKHSKFTTVELTFFMSNIECRDEQVLHIGDTLTCNSRSGSEF